MGYGDRTWGVSVTVGGDSIINIMVGTGKANVNLAIPVGDGSLNSSFPVDWSDRLSDVERAAQEEHANSDTSWCPSCSVRVGTSSGNTHFTVSVGIDMVSMTLAASNSVTRFGYSSTFAENGSINLKVKPNAPRDPRYRAGDPNPAVVLGAAAAVVLGIYGIANSLRCAAAGNGLYRVISGCPA